MPITVAPLSETRGVFARLNIRILGSNPTRALNIRFSSVFVLSYEGSGLATGLITRQRSPTSFL
jgi:hypothetical protein